MSDQRASPYPRKPRDPQGPFDQRRERARHGYAAPGARDMRFDVGEDDWPSAARFVADDGPEYVVVDLRDGDERRVPKRRLAPEVFPPTPKRPLRGSRLLRLSGYALAGALLGGVVGIVVGGIVAVVALIRLAAFAQRTRAWRARQRRRGAPGAVIPLPASATSERLRLLTALGQSALALTLAATELLLLATLLR